MKYLLIFFILKENIFFWTGDNFLIDEKIFQWEKIFLEKHWEMNFEKFSFPQDNFSNIFNWILAPPFLAEKRLVVVKWLPYSSDIKEREKFSDDELENFLETLPKIQEDTIIIFTSWKADKRTKIFKWIQKIAKHEDFKHPDKKINSWVSDFCVRKNISISTTNIAYLLSLTWSDLYNIVNELKKLKNFAGSPGTVLSAWVPGLGVEIQKSDIDKNILDNSEVNIFKITALISSWKTKDAYLELQNLIRAGEEIHYVFNLLIRQFRLLLACFELKHLSSWDIWKTLWIAPFAASSLENQVWNFTLEQLLEKNKKCYEIDKWIKFWKISWDEMLALSIEKELIFG
jgi:DNA polymerase III delta subunit